MPGRPIGRPRRVATVALKLITTEQVAQYLRQLAATGFYGRSLSEVVERLVTGQLGETLLSRFDVFLSHSTKDVALAHELARALERLDLQCFMAERDIEAGRHWKEEIRIALRLSKVAVVLITPAAARSNWVLSEAAASWALGKPLIPALVNVDLKDLPQIITEFQCRVYETMTQRRAFAQELRRICASGPRALG